MASIDQDKLHTFAVKMLGDLGGAMSVPTVRLGFRLGLFDALAEGPATAGVANAAVANLVRQLSWAYGPDGITAHLVAPGPADTERLRNVALARARQSGRDLDDELDDMRAESAIGAFVDVGQVAWGVASLLAPEADALAGSTLFLDAGRRRGLP